MSNHRQLPDQIRLLEEKELSLTSENKSLKSSNMALNKIIGDLESLVHELIKDSRMLIDVSKKPDKVMEEL